ncbi:unnamed protein product, partial [Symbiodinium necroappetens]
MLQEGTIGDTLILFLQCAIFTVLKVRELYAPASFERQRLLEHDVWWNTCVDVEDYVVKLATSLRSAINRDRLSRLLHLGAEDRRAGKWSSRRALRHRFAARSTAADGQTAGRSRERFPLVPCETGDVGIGAASCTTGSALA